MTGFLNATLGQIVSSNGAPSAKENALANLDFAECRTLSFTLLRPILRLRWPWSVWGEGGTSGFISLCQPNGNTFRGGRPIAPRAGHRICSWTAIKRASPALLRKRGWRKKRRRREGRRRRLLARRRNLARLIRNRLRRFAYKPAQRLGFACLGRC